MHKSNCLSLFLSSVFCFVLDLRHALFGEDAVHNWG